VKTLATALAAAAVLATGCAAIIGEPKVRGELEYTTGSNIPVRYGPAVGVKSYGREALERDQSTLGSTPIPSDLPGPKGSPIGF
jgi:hypothetical protein